ncbi:FecR family protein [Larkinella soli]|uniref:FecR family protein n=1 Tax=Larkinella soli TaxID=1770527 RepID=UPI000FFCC476|nr:FecR domain-containing protein [Larkinella soli]
MKHFSAYTAEELAADELFTRWVQHPDDAEVSAFWEGWLTHHPYKTEEVEEARELVMTASRPATRGLEGDEVVSLWGRIRSSIQEMPELQPLQPDVQSWVTNWYIFRWVSAAAGIVLFIGWVLWMQSSQAMETVHTPFGVARNVKLPDGTLVTLNGNSRLRFARVWSEEVPRAVWLEGEAYFTVAHRDGSGEDSKFRVHTSNLTVEVQGTRFNVSQRKEGTRVVLSAGKIKLMFNDRPQIIEMKPGEAVEIPARKPAEQKTSLIRRHVDPFRFTSWTERQLVFDETALSEVAALIQNTYGLTVKFEKPALAAIRVTGTLPSDDVNVLLKALALSSDLQISRQGSQVSISSRFLSDK